MRYLFFPVLVLSILASACSTPEVETEETSELRAAKGERNYGGIFRVNETDPYETLFPPHVELSVSQRTGALIYEGLVKLDQSNLTVIPSLAESWDLDEEGTTYTFNLKEGVVFHDDACFEGGKGRAVVAADFKSVFENMADPKNPNAGFERILKDVVVGATEFAAGTADNISGIEAVNDKTLKITLIKPNSTYLYLLSMSFCWLYPMEAYNVYGADLHVGTGPFVVDSMASNEIWFKRNKNYHGSDEHGNQLPLLDGVNVTFIGETDSVVEAFKAGAYHLIYQLPTDFIIDIIEHGTEKSIEFKEDRKAEMLVQYYELQNQSGIFSDKRIRQAFSYAIDRDMVLNKIVQGDGMAGAHGITPADLFEGYDVSQIKGYGLDVEKAQALMKEAGYAGGSGFPEITLDVNQGPGGIYVKIAEEVKAQLAANLGVTININEVTFQEKNSKAKKGEAMMWRSGWRSDYPHPESFLSLFYGRDVPEDNTQESYPNTSRFVNEEFDALYEQGLNARSIEEGYPFFLQAEQIVMEEAPVIILLYSENYRILQPNVANFPNNAMQYRDLSEVYLEEIPVPEEPVTQDMEASTE